MKNQKLKIIFGIISLGLLLTLLIKLRDVPGGMILSGLYLGGMILVGIVIGCFILTAILRLAFKNSSFLTILYITTTIAFLIFHYHLYSPTLKIIVPNGYRGEINLVLSKVSDNILNVDSNGIGYLTNWTFNKTYSRPTVEQADGLNLDKYLVGFNPSTFWAKGKSCCIENREIHSLSFAISSKIQTNENNFEHEIILGDKVEDYKNGMIIDFIDREKVIFTELDKYSTYGEAKEEK